MKKIYWVLSHHQSPCSVSRAKSYKGIDEEGMTEVLKITDEIEILLPPFEDKTEWVKENWGMYREGCRWINSKNRVRRPIPLYLAKELNLWIVSPSFYYNHASYFVFLAEIGCCGMGNPFAKGHYFMNPFKEAIVSLMHFSTPHYGTRVYDDENGRKLLFLFQMGKDIWKATRQVKELTKEDWERMRA